MICTGIICAAGTFLVEESGKGFKGGKKKTNVSMESGLSFVWGSSGGEREV